MAPQRHRPGERWLPAVFFGLAALMIAGLLFTNPTSGDAIALVALGLGCAAFGGYVLWQRRRAAGHDAR